MVHSCERGPMTAARTELAFAAAPPMAILGFGVFQRAPIVSCGETFTSNMNNYVIRFGA